MYGSHDRIAPAKFFLRKSTLYLSLSSSLKNGDFKTLMIFCRPSTLKIVYDDNLAGLLRTLRTDRHRPEDEQGVSLSMHNIEIEISFSNIKYSEISVVRSICF